MWKQNNVSNRIDAGENHDEPVDTDAHAARGRHPVLQRREEVLVDAFLLLSRLLRQPPPLLSRIIQFGVRGRDFLSANHEFKHVRGFLKHGMGYHRTVVFWHELLKCAGATIMSQHSFDGVWDALRSIAAMLRFDRISFDPDESLLAPAPADDVGDPTGRGEEVDEPVGDGADRLCESVRHDFRRREWSRSHLVDNGRVVHEVAISLQANGTRFGRLLFERVGGDPPEHGEQEMLRVLAEHVSTRIESLRPEMARRTAGAEGQDATESPQE